MAKTRNHKNTKSLRKTHSKRRTGKKSRRMRKNGGGTGFSIPKNPDDSSNCQYSPNTLHEFIISSAQLGDQTELKHLIKTCNEDIVSIINKPYSYGDTAIIFASDRDHNEIAKILIEEGYGTLGEIATATGHSSLSYFSKRYKIYFGVSPSTIGK